MEIHTNTVGEKLSETELFSQPQDSVVLGSRDPSSNH